MATTYVVTLAVELNDDKVAFPDRWAPANVLRATVLDTAPFRNKAFNWEVYPEATSDMARAMFGKGA